MAKAEATTKRVELGQVVEGKGRVWLSRRSVITTPRGISYKYDGCGGGVSKVPAKVRWVKQQENEAAACVGCQHPLFPRFWSPTSRLLSVPGKMVSVLTEGREDARKHTENAYFQAQRSASPGVNNAAVAAH
jgi:hypothetical protein